jgi:hypothetical protein
VTIYKCSKNKKEYVVKYKEKKRKYKKKKKKKKGSYNIWFVKI